MDKKIIVSGILGILLALCIAVGIIAIHNAKQDESNMRTTTETSFTFTKKPSVTANITKVPKITTTKSSTTKLSTTKSSTTKKQITAQSTTKEMVEQEEEIENYPNYSASYFRNAGVIQWDGWRWTWYSQKVLPGGGLNIPGRHVDDNGYVCDENGYICLASTDLPWGTVVSTPFGKNGRVYDSGCSSGTLDVYCDW